MQNMATLENVRITNDGVIKQPVSFGKNIFDFSVVNGRGNIVEGYRLFSDYCNTLMSVFFKFSSSVIMGSLGDAEDAGLRNIISGRLSHVINEKLQCNWQSFFNGLESNGTWNNIGPKLSIRGVFSNIDLPPSENSSNYRGNEGQNRYWSSVWIVIFVADIIVAWFVFGWYFRTHSDLFIVYILIIWFVGAYAFHNFLKTIYPI